MITWYKIRHAGGQAHYCSRTGTLKQRPVTLDRLALTEYFSDFDLGGRGKTRILVEKMEHKGGAF